MADVGALDWGDAVATLRELLAQNKMTNEEFWLMFVAFVVAAKPKTPAGDALIEFSDKDELLVHMYRASELEAEMLKVKWEE